MTVEPQEKLGPGLHEQLRELAVNRLAMLDPVRIGPGDARHPVCLLAPLEQHALQHGQLRRGERSVHGPHRLPRIWVSTVLTAHDRPDLALSYSPKPSAIPAHDHVIVSITPGKGRVSHV